MTGRFAVGDRVRVRQTADPATTNPRTPSYAKGIAGTVIATYGVVANPLDHHEPYLPLYTLRFHGSDIASPDASHVVIAEIHEEWLEPASPQAETVNRGRCLPYAFANSAAPKETAKRAHQIEIDE